MCDTKIYMLRKSGNIFTVYKTSFNLYVCTFDYLTITHMPYSFKKWIRKAEYIGDL